MDEFRNWLGERLTRIEEKIDDGQKHFASIDLTLAKQAADLEHHIKRTDLLETRVEQVSTASELTRGVVKDLVSRGRGIGWLLTAVIAALGAYNLIKGL